LTSSIVALPDPSTPGCLRESDGLDLEGVPPTDQQHGADLVPIGDDHVEVAIVQVGAEDGFGVGLEQDRDEGLSVGHRLQRHAHHGYL
jgi:hypothetical protein